MKKAIITFSVFILVAGFGFMANTASAEASFWDNLSFSFGFGSSTVTYGGNSGYYDQNYGYDDYGYDNYGYSNNGCNYSCGYVYPTYGNYNSGYNNVNSMNNYYPTGNQNYSNYYQPAQPYYQPSNYNTAPISPTAVYYGYNQTGIPNYGNNNNQVCGSTCGFNWTH